ncbi:MAG TPA: wax ester/triacylglycerol synthase family O-acyltransferase [Acidimicrobiia bacterium]|nr:wax ester/triacylglycerol synthase family O-acyltransferase [Acidimicrobiia bacterium]
MQRLSRTDAGFLAAETPEWLMHVGLLMLFDAAGAKRLGPERVRRLVTERFAHLGLFRRRVREMPGRLDRPEWRDVPELDVDAHLRSATVGAPGDARALDRLVGEIFGHPLDRTRPLWELWRLEGLRDGGLALLLKIHHACTDGVNAAEMALVMFDVEPDAPLERPLATGDAGEEPTTGLGRLGESAWSLATTPLRAAHVAGDLARAAPRLGRFALSRERAAALVPFEAPASPFNGALTSRRRFAFCSLPRADVDAVREAAEVSLNDVVLAVCSGSLRRYLVARDAVPDKTMVAQLPMGIRRERRPVDPDAVPGNLLSAMGAALPVHLDGPADRLRAVHASTRAARSLHHALGEDLLAHLVAVPPPIVLSGLVRSYQGLGLEARLPPIFNAIVSNVPGPPVPLYCGGAQLRHGYLLGPLLAGGGLNITVVSYVDSIEIGIVACPDIVDDGWEIAEGMAPALTDLVHAV